MELIEPLGVDLQVHDADAVSLVLRGELDLETAPYFAERVAAACRTEPRELTLDFGRP